LFDFDGIWRRYTACPMRRIVRRAVPCQTTRQNQTKWVLLKEICSKLVDRNNPHVPPRLLGTKEEAVLYVMNAIKARTSTPGTLSWRDGIAKNTLPIRMKSKFSITDCYQWIYLGFPGFW
jgi:hypothetical protein